MASCVSHFDFSSDSNIQISMNENAQIRKPGTLEQVDSWL